MYEEQTPLSRDDEPKSTLVSRNITVGGKRTSVRLEPEMWRALKEIAKREECTIHDICDLICMRKNEKTSLTAAIRVFLMLYFRASSTEQGHVRAGHGNFENMRRRAGVHVRKIKRKVDLPSLYDRRYALEDVALANDALLPPKENQSQSHV